ncbi:MAG: hypothetical protein J0L91_02590 [Burkholderiales bacterium]|nr:hypothetical protein [Burkholderiales bacterium]
MAAWEPGQSGNPAGRPAGVPNVVTRDVRAVIRSFAEAYADRLPSWIDKVAEKDPARAAELFLRACEYVLPKLRVTDINVSESEGFSLIVQERLARARERGGLVETKGVGDGS